MTIEQRLEQVEQQNQQMQLQNSLGLRQLFFRINLNQKIT